MLSTELRPKTWDAVAGQKENIKILRAIVRNPDNSPRTLIFAGEFGSGKTTMARIFARELNKVKDPDFNMDNSPFYYEFDSTVIGNVDEIRRLRDLFTTSLTDYYKVTVLDETHSVSTQAQTALLKVLEEVTDRNFFILCTTHPQKLLPTIRSRALEMDFGLVSQEDIIENLQKACTQINVQVPTKILSTIANRSGGHMRNAHMLLDKFLLLGEKEFAASVKSGVVLYCFLLKSMYEGKDDMVQRILSELLNLPMDILKRDFEFVMVEGMKILVGMESSSTVVTELVKKYYKRNFETIIRLYYSPWFSKTFTETAYFQVSMLQCYLTVKAEMAKFRSING